MKLPFILPILCGAAMAASPIPRDEFFKVETVAEGFADAMELAITPEGYVFVIERTGAVKLVRPTDGKTLEVAKLEVEVRKDSHARECGLLGITLDPDYAGNKWVYLYYSVPGDPRQRLSRFTFSGRTLEDEKILLEIPHEREHAVCHEAGSLAFGPKGNLFLSTGDNTCPFESDGYAPIDEQKGRLEFDAQRSASNVNDLRGKILRITPKPDGTYAIPAGNLFPEGTPSTRPEIFAMGCRNPYRIAVDPHTGFVYWGDVGPDAGADTERGPRGYDEINQARGAGNFGWPYFIADNKPYARYDFRSKRIRTPFDPERPFNSSPNNTGVPHLPKVRPAFWHYPRASACAGAVYHHADYPDSPTKLPAEFDSSLIVFDWTSAWLRVIKLDADGQIVFNEPWLGKYRFVHPTDMAFARDGHLYLLEYGTPWYDGTDGKLKRITYSEIPLVIKVPESDPRMKGLPKDHPGTKLIAASTCLSCHTTGQKSIGPTYREVAGKYGAEDAIRDTLARKIREGGRGAWGEIPMAPHPQHSIEQTRQMVDAILTLKPEPAQ